MRARSGHVGREVMKEGGTKRIAFPFNFTLASKTGAIFPRPSPTRVSRASRPYRARSPKKRAKT